MHTIFSLLSIPEYCHVCVYSRRRIKASVMKLFAQFTSTPGSNALILLLPTKIFFACGVVARKIQGALASTTATAEKTSLLK